MTITSPQENWSEYLDAAPYLVPANPPGKAQIRPSIRREAREFDCACQPFLILPHEVGDDSGSAMLSNERISASMPNLILTSAGSGAR